MVRHRRGRVSLLMVGVLTVGVLGIGVLAGPPAAPAGGYDAPRFPRYLVKPSKASLLRAARLAVRQRGGMSPLGKEESGRKVWVPLEASQDADTWEAIRTAWAERGVEGIGIPPWEWTGMSKDAFEVRVRQNLLFGKDGWKELGVFEPKYIPYFPPDIQKEMGDPLTVLSLHKVILAYLDKHPEITAYYFADGGGNPVNWVGGDTIARHATKFHGNWTYQTASMLVSKGSEFPGDVWSFVQDQIEKPREFTSEGTFTDPQGTRLHWQVTRAQALMWARGLYLQLPGVPPPPPADVGAGNHLNIYPPAFLATWKDSVIKASANHVGFMPLMSVSLSEHGRVTKIEGGGKNGDLFRYLNDLPKFRNAAFPGAPEVGYWHLAADGFAINPKYVRDVDLLAKGGTGYANVIERQRAGVQHFSFTSPAGMFPVDPKMIEYGKKQGLVLSHTAHMHVYFGTAKWKLADSGEWITISDKGNVAALAMPEVRALAARYGDPNLILRYEWVPEIPGINAPGDLDKDYGADPWGWIAKEWARIQSGTYGHYVEDYQLSGGGLAASR